MLIDTHCHIQFKPLSQDIPGVIARAQKEGVNKLIIVGCDVESTKKAIEIAENNEGIFAAVGFHPQDSKKITPEIWEELKSFTSHEKIVAIGETGLDYFKEYSPKQTQIEVFKKHIELAKEFNKPLVVHNRDADEDCLRILQEEGVKDAVFHCFGSDASFARKVWKAGYMTSFTGIITYPSANRLREVVEECPEDAMMIETDCPYLAPQPHRGKTNEPSYVIEVALEIARIKNKQFSEIAEITTKNAEDFFGI